MTSLPQPRPWPPRPPRLAFGPDGGALSSFGECPPDRPLPPTGGVPVHGTVHGGHRGLRADVGLHADSVGSPADLVSEAKDRRMWVHMGRVNSLRRLRYAASLGCDSVDGTFLAFGPDTNLPKLRRFLRWADEPTLFEVPA